MRTKRLFDLFTSLLLIPLFPLWAFFIKGRFRAFGRIIQVLVGSRTMIAYLIHPDFDRESLPPVKKGILSPEPAISEQEITGEQADRINMMYAKDYKLSNDITIFWKGFRHLGVK